VEVISVSLSHSTSDRRAAREPETITRISIFGHNRYLDLNGTLVLSTQVLAVDPNGLK